MAWVLAIDFGTSSTAAAVGFDGNAQSAPIEGTLTTMLSNVFLDESRRRLLLGAQADNAAVYAPWCLERTPKRRIGMPYMRLGQENVEVAHAVGEILRRAADAAIEFQGGVQPVQVRLTHPVRWGKERREGLREAARKAGWTTPELILEPVAAALSYAHEDLAVGEHVAVYDLGGGTFDTAVLKRTEEGFSVVGQPGGSERFGGEEFDTRLHRHLGHKLPEAQWQRLLAKPQSLTDAPWAQANRQFMRNVRRAKELLTAVSETEVIVPAPVEVKLPVTREEFQNIIRADIEESVRELQRTIDSVRLTGEERLRPSQLAAIYLAGGSSNIPLVAELIKERLGIEPILLPQPKEAISIGAARGAQPAQSSNGSTSGVDVPQDDETRWDIEPLDREPQWKPPEPKREEWKPPEPKREEWTPPEPKREEWRPPEREPEPDRVPVTPAAATLPRALARVPIAAWGIACTLGALIVVLAQVSEHTPFKEALGFDVILAVIVGAITALELRGGVQSLRGDLKPVRPELLWLRGALALVLAGENFVITNWDHYGSVPSQEWIACLASLAGAAAGIVALYARMRPAASEPAAGPVWRQPYVIIGAACALIAISFFLHGTSPYDGWYSQAVWSAPVKRLPAIMTGLAVAVGLLSWRGMGSARARAAAMVLAAFLAGIVVPGVFNVWKHVAIGEWLGILGACTVTIATALAAGALRWPRQRTRT